MAFSAALSRGAFVLPHAAQAQPSSVRMRAATACPSAVVHHASTLESSTFLSGGRVGGVKPFLGYGTSDGSDVCSDRTTMRVGGR
eukprot:CAMPEP_0198209184 /NCGR_PEP_ID=MMETSP1445-20131203/13739_1 /TAXON_ID=36898 /ORGANISM="Pyramimonas sp., Strain CCMP2087" /LENGTH=84 /DNA_ID=CAMNT_0043882863 /DNA_START=87 /DNA_END=338 /DNA_ORIENTATION=-